jgi:hypothetical protein
MSQVTGFPGGGLRISKTVGIFSGVGNPNSSTQANVIRAGLGSIFLREDIGQIWCCTSAAIPQTTTNAAVNSAWTQIS